MPTAEDASEDADRLLARWRHVIRLRAAVLREDDYAILRSLGALWNELAPGELDNPRRWAALTAAPMASITPAELRTFTALLCAVWYGFAPLVSNGRVDES